MLPYRPLLFCLLLSGCNLAGSTFGIEAAQSPADVRVDRVQAELERVWELAASADGVWPGFHLLDQVLVLTLLPSGPVFLVGDSTPPPEFRWVDSTRRIAVRHGAPPVWLTKLQIGATWNEMAATVAPFPSSTSFDFLAAFLLHEAFHTHQHHRRAADPTRFVARGSGVAWLLLLDRLDVPHWRERVELTPPDQILAEAIGRCNGAMASSLFDAGLIDPAWVDAQASAVATGNLILLGGRNAFGRNTQLSWTSP